jgi:Asp-tRNA(Asn)/Glu-tRNA(Gln) amidotransferase A subunit family amidase
MVPCAIGTQVGGSIIRPAAFCGNVALKPTQGGINRGERQATSMSTHGVHANCIEDMWQTAIEIAKRAGGDRGCPGLYGPDVPPAPVKPERLIVLETAGWEILDDTSKTAFEGVLEGLRKSGVTLLRRADHVLVEALEQAIAEAVAICAAITRWENRWGHRNLVEQKGEFVSDRLKAGLKLAEAMTPDDYRAALMAREAAQRCHTMVAPLADAAITLSCPGPAPLWPGDIQGQPLLARPTGDAIFNTPSSMLFAPCVTMPLMAVGGLPVGAQVMGQPHQDAAMTAIARWMLETTSPIIVTAPAN